jgi:DNA primase small subunit
MYEQQQSREAEFLRKLFADYYSKHTISSVPSPEFREFGYGVYRKKIANRNMAFSTEQEMNYFLRTSAPLFFSYSNAYYKFPAKTPMQSKELFKADIIYEFDADELGIEVEEINGIQWFKEIHLEEAKKQVYKLLNFIVDDFNLPLDDLSINFSGKAGFHVHLRGKEIQELKKKARIELVDYLTAQNIDYINLGFDLDALIAPRPVGLWQKRLLDGIREFFKKDEKEIAKITGFQKKKISSITNDVPAILSSLDKGVLVQLDGRKSADFWRKVLDSIVEKEKSPIDRQTSIDLHKIIRVPETLHGDTGFIAKKLSLDELKKFNPYNDAIVFDDGFAKQNGINLIEVKVNNAPKFSLLGKEFGPFNDEEVKLPLYAAVYLVGKGAAVLK